MSLSISFLAHSHDAFSQTQNMLDSTNPSTRIIGLQPFSQKINNLMRAWPVTATTLRGERSGLKACVSLRVTMKGWPRLTTSRSVEMTLVWCSRLLVLELRSTSLKTERNNTHTHTHINQLTELQASKTHYGETPPRICWCCKPDITVVMSTL